MENISTYAHTHTRTHFYADEFVYFHAAWKHGSMEAWKHESTRGDISATTFSIALINHDGNRGNTRAKNARRRTSCLKLRSCIIDENNSADRIASGRGMRDRIVSRVRARPHFAD